MNSLTKEEYLKLLEEVSRTEATDDLDYQMENAWVPADPAIKETIKKSGCSGKTDITNLKKAEIGAALLRYSNVIVGDFLIRINKCSEQGHNLTTHLNMEIWERRYRTPSGNPCNMDFRINLHKDTRFNNCHWVTYFNTRGEARNVIIASAVEIIRWLQASKRVSAFM